MDLDQIAATLAERRADLARELARLTAPPAVGQNLSFGKRIGDGTTEAVERISTTATARSISASLDEVERALAKIDDGSYGRCDSCGQAIPADRLEARPATALCIECSRLAAD